MKWKAVRGIDTHGQSWEAETVSYGGSHIVLVEVRATVQAEPFVVAVPDDEDKRVRTRVTRLMMKL